LPVEGTPGGFAIYRLESVEQKPAPPDLKKAREDYVLSLAARELQDRLAQARNTTPVKWSVPGFGVLYEWYKTTLDPQANQAFAKKPASEQRKYQQGVFDRAFPQRGDEGGAMAAVGSMEAIWTRTTPAEKQKLQKNRTDALLAALQFF